MNAVKTNSFSFIQSVIYIIVFEHQPNKKILCGGFDNGTKLKQIRELTGDIWATFKFKFQMFIIIIIIIMNRNLAHVIWNEM